MTTASERAALEIESLRRCLNDLVGTLALPAIWAGREPERIVETLLDSLSSMLSLDFAYARVIDPSGETPTELLRVADPTNQRDWARDIKDIVSQHFAPDVKSWPSVVLLPFADGKLALVPLQLGIYGQAGLIVAASRRAGFPQQTESLVLNVAANQALVALQEAQLRISQRRAASELDRRVRERSAELAASNAKLELEALERTRAERDLRVFESHFRQIVDCIPGLVCTLDQNGETRLFNRQILEFFGKTPDQLRDWATSDAVHPDDLPAVKAAFAAAMTNGTGYDVEHRCRRADGVYRWFQVRALPVRDAGGVITGRYVLFTDIDDRKRAEELARASERNLKQIIDTIPTLAWSADPDGTADYFNQHYLDYVGLTTEQARGTGWTSAVHPDDLNGLVQDWQRIMASERAGEAEARLRRADGEYRWLIFRPSPLRDERGTIIKWYGVNTDIEDRKQAEEKLRQSELNARLIVESIPAFVAVLGASGVIEQVNHQLIEYFGSTREAMIGQGIGQFGQYVHPDEHGRTFDDIRQAIASGRSYETERRYRRFDGVYRWLQVRASPLKDEMGSVVRWYYLLVDVEDRKRADEKLQRSESFLAEAQRVSATGSFSWRLDSDEIKFSSQLHRLFEFEPDALVTLERIGEKVHPDDLPLLSTKLENARRGGGESGDLDYEIRLRMPDGRIKYVHTIGHVIRHGDGRLECLGAIQDETQRKLAKEALDKARSELAHVTRVMSLGTMTASIAHEVNQPLAGIITNGSTCLRMLAAEPPNIDGARETARRTIRDGTRAAEVITRLRALFSKEEATHEALDLNDATREVIALSLNELQRNRVVLRQELATSLPLVSGDRVQLQQVILNLLLNASEAMSSVDDRPRELSIKTEPDGEDGVRVSVRDSGIGFEAQDTDKLFSAFYTTKSGGMGIGLSVSRSIIESHRGRLWAAENDGPGATFAFSIPRYSEGSSAGPAPS